MSAFVHASLVAGVALAAIPVIIHLIMRQTPKHIVFPALRLIRERQKRSRKRLKIRNWLLLAARMALIALMALALARPRLYSQTTLGDREVPTALAFVFDTSLSMEYKEKEKTRLREAQDRALEILKKTHESSRVFVIDSAEAILPMAMSPAAARKRIESLTIRPVNRPLNGAIGLAYRAIAPLDLPRHEVYVLTDLARSAWTLDQPVEGLEALKNVKGGIATYILRLSPKDLRDVAVVEAEPSSAIVAQDEPVAIKGRVRSIGPAAKRVVELWIDGRKKDQKLIAIPANGEVEIPEFHTAKLSPGFHQGEIRLGGEPDPLERDDRRYFTLDVQPALKVLLVADQDREARFVHNALEPAALRPGGAPPARG
ncbi:MAG: BatA domain-containing protein, partial [Isosphaeraceae bacterium]|nr:BatA domain-containing protein [Isosphaeraceae bacterium]